MPSPLAPRFWGAHLLALVLVGIAVALGVWQYDAWRAHREDKAADLARAEPLAVTEVIGPDDPFPGDRIGQPVTVRGTWLPESTVYVSGRVHDGVQGYWVVTPVAVHGAGDSALPIVRGWTGEPGTAPRTAEGPIELDAWLQPPEGTGAVDEDPTDDVLPQLRIPDLLRHVDQDLFGAYGVARQPEAGLEPASVDQLPDVGAFTSIKNLLYAVEWWIFGLFAAFIWWRWVREITHPESVPEQVAGDAGSPR